MHMPLPGAGYVLGNQNVLPEITKFIKSQDPDIVGLIEVDTGSIRSRMVNQAEKIAADLSMNTSYETKYGEKSINQILPIVRKQGKGPLYFSIQAKFFSLEEPITPAGNEIFL